MARAVLVSGPVAPRILLQPTVVGELVENLSAKNAEQINRVSCRRPDPEGGAVGTKRRAVRCLRRNLRLGKHGLLLLHYRHRRLLYYSSISMHSGPGTHFRPLCCSLNADAPQRSY